MITCGEYSDLYRLDEIKFSCIMQLASFDEIFPHEKNTHYNMIWYVKPLLLLSHDTVAHRAG